jgi:phage portal protein BeeE
LTDQKIAAVFGVPGILLGIHDTATQKTTEAMMAEWLASGLGFVINHIEQAIDAFIGLSALPAGREWTEFDTSALLRSMFKDQIDGLARSVQAGIHAPNDARRIMGLSAAKKGDEPRVQQQMVPLSFEEPQPPPPQPVNPPAAPVPDPKAQKEFALFLMRQARDRDAA